MKITNYNFKHYFSCENYYPLDSLRKSKLLSEIKLDEAEKRKLLNEMYDEEGKDIIEDPSYAACNYELANLMFKKWIIKVCNKKIEFEKTYSLINAGVEFKCIVDACFETDDEVCMIKFVPSSRRSYLSRYGKRNTKLSKVESKHFEKMYYYEYLIKQIKKTEDPMDIEFVKYVYENTPYYNQFKNNRYFCVFMDAEEESNFCIVEFTRFLEERYDFENKVNYFLQHTKEKETFDLVPCKDKQCRFYEICRERKNEDNEIEYETMNFRKLARTISKITYPIYFLDFESYSSIYPRFPGEKPFSNHVFMYSVIVQEEKAGKLKKEVYISPDNINDHRYQLFKKLTEFIGMTGTVVVYNDTFEKGRLTEAAEMYPDLKEHLDAINNNILDLLWLIKGHRKTMNYTNEKNNYYNSRQNGSYTLKTMYSLFSEEGYSKLSIRNGQQASNTYAILDELDEEEREKEIQNLIDYCYKDTKAMYIVLREIIRKVKESISSR